MKQIALKTTIPEDIWERFERELRLEGVKKSDWLKEMMYRRMGYWREKPPYKEAGFSLLRSIR